MPSHKWLVGGVISVPLSQPTTSEIVAKLVKAGYLLLEHRHDADAITSAVAKMKEDLRNGVGGDDAKRRRE